MQTYASQSPDAGRRPRGRRRLAAGFILAVAWAAAGAARCAQGQTGTVAITAEYKVKATFLFRFAQFVEWPPAAFAATNAPVVIGLLGADPFGPFLEELVQGETIRNRAVKVVRAEAVADLPPCHILFISKSEQPRLEQELAFLKPSSVLTVGETADFARRGGVVNFYMEKDTVRLEFNPAAARRKGLEISSQLLRLGRTVKSAETESRGVAP
jgi:hypothetical protein